MKNHTAYWQSTVAFAINFFAGCGFFIAFLVQYFDKEIVIYDLLFYALILWAISAAFLVVTSYSYPGFSAEKNSTPSYRSAEPPQPMYSQAQKAPSVSADSWTCTCGRVNPSYQTTCSCGVKKPAPKANGNRPAAAQVAATGDWRCTCGRVNPSYQTTCSCGARKPH